MCGLLTSQNAGQNVAKALLTVQLWFRSLIDVKLVMVCHFSISCFILIALSPFVFCVICFLFRFPRLFSHPLIESPVFLLKSIDFLCQCSGFVSGLHLRMTELSWTPQIWFLLPLSECVFCNNDAFFFKGQLFIACYSFWLHLMLLLHLHLSLT